MIRKIIGALILCLVLFSPNEALAQTEETKSATSKETKNTVDIPDDILKNLGKKSGTPSQGGVEEGGAMGQTGEVQKNTDAPKGNNAVNQGKKKDGVVNAPSDTKKLKPGVHKFQGYRIQVFSDGSNQSTLQTRARARGNAIVAKFPKYRGQVYSFSKAPNWYTQIGNFLTQDEANKALAELKRAFPNFANEMRIVKSKVTIIKK